MVFGYLRVSTNKQDAESQKIGIVKKSQELGIEIDEWIVDDGVSGVTEYSKRNLGVLMEKIKEGDTLIVSEISRLARSVFMLHRIVEHCVQTNNCEIHAVKENQIFRKNDTISAIILSAFGTAAQIEREMIIKRTLAGIEKGKQNGKIFGRPVGYNVEFKLEPVHDKILKCINDGLSKQKIANMFGCSKQTLYNYFKRKKIFYRIHSKRKSPNYKLTSKNMLSVTRQKYLEAHKKDIIRMIKSGLTTPRKICESIQGRGIEMGFTTVRLFFAKHPEIYSMAIEKNLAIRKLQNSKFQVVRVVA